MSPNEARFGERIRKALREDPGPMNGAHWRPRLRRIADAVDGDAEGYADLADALEDAVFCLEALAPSQSVFPATMTARLEGYRAALRKAGRLP